MNKTQLLPLLISISASSTLFAAGAPVGTIFPEGSPVDPLGANANFQELADRVDDLDTSLTLDIESAFTQLDQDIIDLSSLLDSYSSALTTEFYQLQDDVLSESARIDAEVTRLNGQISENEERDNSNLQSLNNRITDAAPTVKYTPNENLATRTFVDLNPESAGECDVRNDSFNFDTSEKTYVQDVTVNNSNDSLSCADVTYYWDYSDGIASSFLISHTSSADIAITLSQPWQVVKGTTRIGESWGTYSARTFSVDGNGSYPLSSEYHRMTLLGIEDIAVPAGSFSDCLVIEDQIRRDNTVDTRLYYFCEAPGVVRIVGLDTGRDWQLQSFTEN
ncbi:MAG: hypothetical protein K6L81_04155 [Agarilytica sp.]